MYSKLLFFLSFFFFYSGVNAQPDGHEYIQWTPSYQLNWNDFAGRPGAGAIGDAGTAVAIKARPYIEQRKIHYIVRALFNKSRSWHRDKSPSLLAHEQLHFDLAELYARKARKKIIEIAMTGEKDLKVYNRAVQEILNESNMIDRQYDAETLHGAMAKKQQEWKDKITKDLLALEAYKEQRVNLN